MVPAEAVVADIREPKSVVVPSEAPPSELGFTRQLLKDGGEEKLVPPPGRNDASEKLRKSEEEGAEGVLLALVNRRPGGMRDRWKIETMRWTKERSGDKMEQHVRWRSSRETDITAAKVSKLLSLPSSWEQQTQDNQNKHFICSPAVYLQYSQPSLIM